MYDMVKLGKRNVPLALHDKKCLGLLMASYQQLESAKTNCRNFDEDCERYDKDSNGIFINETNQENKMPLLETSLTRWLTVMEYPWMKLGAS